MPYVQDQSLTGAASASPGGPSTRPFSFHLQLPPPSIAMVDNEQRQHQQKAPEWTVGKGRCLDNPQSPANHPYSQWNRPVDPRTSSTQSLGPSTLTDQAGSYRDPRRTLLVVYIHGFMGNDSSFRSFPAHVHNYLREALAETHVIHSKIYPRYKTYKSITVARDNFSTWLLPHESPTTDVVLVGHSMGGLLAAEVALLPRQPHDPVYGNSPFRHRILGTLSLDAPLLGLHPGIVVSGIASLFRKAPSPPGAENSAQGSQTLVPQQSPGLSPDPSIYSELCTPPEATSPLPGLTPPSTVSSPSAADPFFNPKFFNDVSFVDRGWFKNIAHFAQKHSQENLVEAATNHIISHLEFGGCLADYPGMKSRYNRLRRLEDVDDLRQDKEQQQLVRLRFVNYYTVSTGILKEKDSRKKSAPKATSDVAPEGHSRSHSTSKTVEKAHDHDRESFDTSRSHSSTPRSSEELELTELEPVPISNDDETTQRHGHRQHVEKEEDKPPAYASHEEVNKIAEQRHSISNSGNGSVIEPSSTATSSLPPPDLPPIPTTPSPPEAIDLSSITSKEERKQAEKDFKQARKEYEAAVKSRDKVLKERLKIVEKHEKAKAKLTKDTTKQQEKAEKDNRKQQERLRKDTEKQEKKDKKEWERRQKKEDKLRAESTANRIGELESHHLAHNNNNNNNNSSQVSVSAESPRSPGGENEETEPTGRKDKDKGKKKEKEKEPKKKEKEKKQKLRKFCMLPSKANGIVDDPTWIQVYMEGVDEVGAHCGLFFPGPHYDKLVGDVSSRIVGWVQDDMSKRLVLERIVEGLELT